MSLNRKLFFLKICVIVLTLCSIGLSYFFYESQYKKDIKSFINEEIMFSKNMISSLLNEMEEKFQEKSHKFQLIHSEALQILRENPNKKLEDIKQFLMEKYQLQNININLFLINKSYIIYKATFKKDLNFNLSKSSNALRTIKRLKNKDDVISLKNFKIDPLEKVFKIYSFAKYDNENFLELSFEDKNLEKFLFDRLEYKYKKNTKITLYNVKRFGNKYSYYTLFGKRDKISKEKFYSSLQKFDLNKSFGNPIMQVHFSKKSINLEGENCHTEYLRVFEEDILKEHGLENIIAEIKVDTTAKNELLKNIRYIFIFSMIISTIILLLLFFLIKQQLLKPINIIIKSIKNVNKIPIKEFKNQNHELSNVAFEYNKMYDHLKTEIKKNKKLTQIDHLTKVGNRKMFDKKLNEMIINKNRYNNIFTLMMIDLDDFKKVNDEFGHQKGDEVLIEFAEVLKEMVRKSDYIFRIGGEEFAIIFPQTTLNNSLIIAKKIQKKTYDSFIDLREESLTISSGLYEIENEDNHRTIFKKTDDLLYEAKNTGKNKILY